ncbi:hypothetical protein Anas_03575 [Armadillidium nasatum]|uniref:Uncharacterized protein n=1 Tax=Armadillidium nasatum TaxID=96803 RepID=A0A5N5TNB1_9CRUS|nr:hypothetical protein Anas_03575 [Armadillidium nasatum]
MVLQNFNIGYLLYNLKCIFHLCKMEINCKSKVSNESQLIEEVESYFKDEEMIMKNGLCQKAERMIIEDEETELQVRVELKEDDSKAEDTDCSKRKVCVK